MIFEAIKSELFRLNFHSLSSKIEKFPEFNLRIPKVGDVFMKVTDDAVTNILTNHFNLTTATFKLVELTYMNIEQNPILYYQYRMETI